LLPSSDTDKAVKSLMDKESLSSLKSEPTLPVESKLVQLQHHSQFQLQVCKNTLRNVDFLCILPDLRA
jgi:hypothetical protein